MSTIVTTQEELDAAIEAGKTDIVIEAVGRRLRVSGRGAARAVGHSWVVASEGALVIASDFAHVWAFGSAHVVASGFARVNAADSATVVASGSAMVHAFDTAQVMAYGFTVVSAHDSAQVWAFESAIATTDGDVAVQLVVTP